MIGGICSFTKKGKEVEEKLKRLMRNDIWISSEDFSSLDDFVSDAFRKRLPVVLIGACGIAVRLIAPFVKDKLTDSPVIVIDEKACFVIPVLSGHIGGANALAEEIASALKAQAVITTATDEENVFSVDVFALKNGLRIVNRDGIKKVSSMLLKGKKVSVFIDPAISVLDKNSPANLMIKETADANILILSDGKSTARGNLLTLAAKTLCLGIGCRRGKSFEQIRQFIESHLTEEQIQDIASISSIDIKKDERGLMELSQFYRVPFRVYSAEELEKAELEQGVFSESEFVREKTGASNVCERAAVLAAGGRAALEVKKIAEDGITMACARKPPEIKTWNTKIAWSER